ncbi:Ion channel [Ancylostoma ceylanicum]|uniref:Ion channel n=1 Tax=Ancylostoma ceylanicum TaxID=53326 RepID=A0A0D6LNB3_9BILA|nr:Ion channel [Ancylostoma ceylanicum]
MESNLRKKLKKKARGKYAQLSPGLNCSLAGALVFCGLESSHEDVKNDEEVTMLVRRSVAAKKELVDKIQMMYFSNAEATFFNETELRKAIDSYDVSMAVKPIIHREKRWNLWGGLYYAGTIYTTIDEEANFYAFEGYGDLAATTFWGRLFTMIYALVGIPMVITILNDWGTIMFQIVDMVWRKNFRSLIHPIKNLFRSQKHGDSQENICDNSPPLTEKLSGDPDAAEPIPFYLVIIGFGDITPGHSVAVANFLLILIGLSVVSMSINVLQMQLEILFARVVKSIDNDFKMNLSVSAEENKKTASLDQRGDVERGPSELRPRKELDVVKQYGKNMNSSDRFLMRFMSHHQKKMLNEKFEDRAKMRNKWTQTAKQIKVVASVQTADKYDDFLRFVPETEEEEVQPKSRITTKRLYIYNTGE